MHSLNRRELLATFLGLPVALQGCGQQELPPLPPGELVGASVSLGHRLRDGLNVDVPEDRWRQTRFVIVGGGVAGLSAARRLLQAGVEDFVLLELEPEPGGTSRSGQGEVVSFPWGAHYVPAPTKDNPALVQLLEELDAFEGVDESDDPVVAEQYLCRDPQERIFYKGRWYEGLYLHAGTSDEDARQLEDFRREIDRWVAWRDGQGRRAFTIPMALGSDDAEVTALDKMSMADWMDSRGYTSERLRWLIDYACRDDYGSHPEETSAWAGLFYFASRKPNPGQPSRPFITWPEGNGRIVSHLYRQAKKQTHLSTAAAEIAPVERDGKPGVDVVAITDSGESALGFRADRVIFAAPHFLAQRLIRDYRRTPPDHIREFQYGAWMVANLTLDVSPTGRGFPMAWDNVLYDSPSLGYVSATHQRGMDYGPHVLTYYYPLCDADATAARRRLLEVERDGWAEIALADLQRAHPNIRTATKRLDVMRWGHAMIRPRPEFIFGGAREKATEPYRGIYFANTDLSGIALFEEAFYRGTKAAEAALA